MISPAIAPNMHFEGGGEKAERPAADVIAVVADDIFRFSQKFVLSQSDHKINE